LGGDVIHPKDVKLFIATPFFGGATYNYVQGIFNLGYNLGKLGVHAHFAQTLNNPYIWTARNRLVADFLKTDFTHFMFIDQDVGFLANDVFALIQEDKDIVAGTYPLKQINWEYVEQAVKDGVPAEKLESHTAMHVFLPVNKQDKPNNKELLEVINVGTGFMLIKREVFEKLAETVNTYFEVITPELRVKTLDFFGHERVDDEFWGEDVSFCMRVRGAGMKIYVAPWVQCSHYGSYHYNQKPHHLQLG
jgi:GT2 family glycosyltransferase